MGLFGEEGQGPGTDEAEDEEVEQEHQGSLKEDSDLLASCGRLGVDGVGCHITEQSLAESPVFGQSNVDAPC